VCSSDLSLPQPIGGQPVFELVPSSPTSKLKNQTLKLDEKGKMEGRILVHSSCNKMHYSGGHHPGCFHRISFPIFFSFEIPETAKPPKTSKSSASKGNPLPSSSPTNQPLIGALCGPVWVLEPPSWCPSPAPRELPKGFSTYRTFHFGTEEILYREKEVVDGFGHVVWDAAFVLAHHLGQLGPRELKGKRCVEVGSGVGLVGLCAALLGASATLTDMPSALPITEEILRLNQPLLKRKGAHATAAPLSWGSDPAHLSPPFDVILASDVVYHDDLFEVLVSSLRSLSGPNTLLLLSGRERHGCGFDKFLQKLGEEFDGGPVELEGNAASLADATALSKSKRKPRVFRMKMKKPENEKPKATPKCK